MNDSPTVFALGSSVHHMFGLRGCCDRCLLGKFCLLIWMKMSKNLSLCFNDVKIKGLKGHSELAWGSL